MSIKSFHAFPIKQYHILNKLKVLKRNGALNPVYIIKDESIYSPGLGNFS